MLCVVQRASLERLAHTLGVFRIEFSEAAQGAIEQFVPGSVVARAVEMLHAVGDAALELARAKGLPLARDRFSHSLTSDKFHFFYTLDLENQCITVFSVIPNIEGRRVVLTFRQPDGERRSPLRRRGDLNCAAMGADDLVDDVRPEAQPLPIRCRRVQGPRERLEDARPVATSNPARPRRAEEAGR